MYRSLSYSFLSFLSLVRAVFSNPETAQQSIAMEALIDTADGINGMLIHAFAHGSRPAFRSIYDRYAPTIYRVSCRYLQSEQLAEELVSEVFSALWFKRVKFTEPEEVRLFLFTSARSVAMKYLEKGRKEASPLLTL